MVSGITGVLRPRSLDARFGSELTIFVVRMIHAAIPDAALESSLRMVFTYQSLPWRARGQYSGGTHSQQDVKQCYQLYNPSVDRLLSGHFLPTWYSGLIGNLFQNRQLGQFWICLACLEPFWAEMVLFVTSEEGLMILKQDHCSSPSPPHTLSIHGLDQRISH